MSPRTVLSARLVQGVSVTTDFANRYQYDALSRIKQIDQNKWSTAVPPVTVQGGWTEGIGRKARGLHAIRTSTAAR